MNGIFFAEFRGPDVGLVLVVGGNELDLLAEHLAAEIGDRHLRGLDAALADHVGIEARHIVDVADDDAFGLRLRRGGERQRGHGGQCAEEGRSGHVCSP